MCIRRWVRAGGKPVWTLDGHELKAVADVPMAGGQIVTISLDGRVFVGQKPYIGQAGYLGGTETWLTTNLPNLPALKAQLATASEACRIRGGQVNVQALCDVLAVDANGNPTFEPSGMEIEEKMADGRVSKMKHGLLRLSDNSAISAYKNNSNLSAFDFNCHGYSIAGGQFFIDSRDMQEWLDRTRLLSKTNAPRLGDLVVYRNRHGNIMHSAVLTAVTESTEPGVRLPSRVTMAAGAAVYENDFDTTPMGDIVGESKITTVPVGEAWDEPETSIEYWAPRTSRDPGSAA